MDKVIKQLVSEDVGKVLQNEPLSKHTTMRIGGPADIFVIPKDIEGLKKTIQVVKENNLPLTAIGRGSNLVIDDEGLRGVVIKIGEGLDHLNVDGTKVTVGAGYSIVKLATQMSRQGLSGLAFASGIPGNMGGALYMNAGAHGADMSTIVTRAHILQEDGTFVWLDNEQLNFSYRTSYLQIHGGIVIEIELQLEQGDPNVVSEIMQRNKEYRKKTQPWNSPCAGSIFRNPLPLYAGKLIEDANLKGFTIGGAQISPMHGNFIVNVGNATAKDVLSIIEHVQRTIKEKDGVDLQTEVKFLWSSQQSLSN
ncbi:MAG: UDP-N-acetylmuramate dehydrogenase [Bacillaceae bacterium]